MERKLGKGLGSPPPELRKKVPVRKSVKKRDPWQDLAPKRAEEGEAAESRRRGRRHGVQEWEASREGME
mgnify:CR=1 FL=1